MKKINSIWFGSKILALGAVLTFVIPLLLYGAIKLAGESNAAFWVLKASVGAGLLVFAVFFIILAIELKQDRAINRKYERNRYSRVRISDDVYECQNCGSRKVRESDRGCGACGVRFME